MGKEERQCPFSRRSRKPAARVSSNPSPGEFLRRNGPPSSSDLSQEYLPGLAINSSSPSSSPTYVHTKPLSETVKMADNVETYAFQAEVRVLQLIHDDTCRMK